MKTIMPCLLPILFGLLFLSVSSADQKDREPNVPTGESEPVLKTAQGKLILNLFRQSEQLHLIVLSVRDEATFIIYERRLDEVTKSLRQTLSEMAKMEPLGMADQASLRQALQKEEGRIMTIAEQASQHIEGLKNIRLREQVQLKQTEFLNQVSPAISKQSARHYKP